MPTRVIRPFDGGGWFSVHNAVFDVIMPRLSPTAWRVLCVVLRQTWGWVAYARRHRGQSYNLPGFLISGLRSGNPPPKERSPAAWTWEQDREELKRRYAPFPQIRT